MELTKSFVNHCRSIGVLRDFLCQAIDQVDKKDKEIARQNIEIKEAVKTMKSLEAEIIELNKKLESVQASMYADIVDANMDNRRLKRALYKACANWAMNARMVEIEAEPWGENHESHLWAGVYDKCLKKAEEYK